MLDRPVHAAGSASDPEWDRRRIPAEPDLSGASLAGFVAALRQRRHVLIATVILIPLCTWLTLRQVTPLYTATGALVYEPSEYKPRELQSILQSDPTTEAMMATQAELLQSLHIA